MERVDAYERLRKSSLRTEETSFVEELTPDYGFVADQENEETTTQALIPDYDLVFNPEPNTDDSFFNRYELERVKYVW